MPDEPRKAPPETIEAESLEPTVSTTEPPAADVASLPVVSPEHYAVEGEFARGGMGRILLARDRRLRRPVAVKELHSDQSPGARRFVREALLTARLQHPSIVPVYEAGRWPDGVPFYAMKLVQGRALEALIDTAPGLSDRLALLPHVIAVAEAVAYAHQQRIVHRDLKPGNVLVGSFGETVVVDWGLAKDLAESSVEEAPHAAPVPTTGPEQKTVVGTVLGTPHYMPPEQARGEAVDERADVYALGAMLYYLLAGKPPHAGKTVAQALAAAATEPPKPVETIEPDVPHELGAIVRKAMARTPDERYPTAREMAADLKRFQTGQLVSVHRYSTWELLRRWVGRHRAAVTVAAVLTVALVASLVAGVVGIRSQRDKARLEAAKAERINEFVQDMLGSADPRIEGKDVTVASVLAKAAERAKTELADQPEVQAAVQATIGATYEALGLYEPAQRQVRAALETRRRVLGPDHRDVAQSLAQLADLMTDEGDFTSAESLQRQAVALYEKLGLGERLEAVMARTELAGILQSLGRLDEAERLHREALAQKKLLLGSEHHIVAESLNNLGVVLGNRGRWEEAAVLHRESLEIMRKVHGPEHPEVAAAANTLAGVLEALGDFAGAEALFREALALRTKLLGSEHPDVAWTNYNYAFLLRRKGETERGLRLCREVLALRGKTLPEGHPLIAAGLQLLGLILIDQGRAQEALPLLREGLDLRRQVLPKGHWFVASSQSALGACLVALGRFGEAEPLLVGGYESLKTSHGETHERTVEARQRLLALYEAWKKPEKAAAYRP